jgi:6-methylsalicylate decarboxylase
MHAIRRNVFLAGLGAAGITLAPGRVFSQGAGRIDVHHHYNPPSWETTLRAKNEFASAWKGWTPQAAIEEMDRGGVQKAMLSITTPGIWFGDDAAARKLARECNEYAAQMRADHPGRFGIFTALPLPDVAGSLQEIAYGLDTLKADGVGLLTSYVDKWIGDPAFDPIFEELNRRHALVFVHPTTAKCCVDLLPGISDSAIEYGTDTTRALARFIFSGSSTRFTNIRMIFSHAGGTMPFLDERFIHMADRTPKYKALLPNGFLPEARRFYYDTAQVTTAAPMAALTKIIPLSHIVFGTDYPYLTIVENVEGLKDCGIFNARELAAIDRNAAALLS